MLASVGNHYEGMIPIQQMSATEDQISHVVQAMSSATISCPECKTRIRYGDYECPRCGNDIEDQLRAWAAWMLEPIQDS